MYRLVCQIVRQPVKPLASDPRKTHPHGRGLPQEMLALPVQQPLLPPTLKNKNFISSHHDFWRISLFRNEISQFNRVFHNKIKFYILRQRQLLLKFLKPLDVNTGLKCKCDLIVKNWNSSACTACCGFLCVVAPNVKYSGDLKRKQN